VNRHAVALVAAVGDGEHDLLALPVDVGAAQSLVVNSVQRRLRVWADSDGHDGFIQLLFPELLGDHGFKIQLRALVGDLVGRRHGKREARRCEHREAKDDVA